ncbi:MAG: hypothetical protein JKX82_07835 [Oleispira sp.]|nr:hypothetical protein [Oleispira sp.]
MKGTTTISIDDLDRLRGYEAERESILNENCLFSIERDWNRDEHDVEIKKYEGFDSAHQDLMNNLEKENRGLSRANSDVEFLKMQLKREQDTTKQEELFLKLSFPKVVWLYVKSFPFRPNLFS